MRTATTFRLPRALVAAAILVLSIVGLAGRAEAHAELLLSTPADGAILDTSPEDITLQFTEAIQLQPDGVRVVDADGQRVDAGNAVAEGSTVTAPLDGELDRGSYVVAWRVVSADGHPIRGAFTFSVGQESQLDEGLATSAFGAGGSDRSLEIVGAVLRILAYLGTLGACGVVLVGARLRRPDEPTPVQRGVTVGIVVALVAIAAQGIVLAALATGRGLGAITESGVLSLVLGDGFGPAAVLALVALLAVLITSGLPFDGAAKAIAITGAVVAPLSFALTGHTRTMEPAAVGYLADLAHLLAGTVWFGGLIAAVSAVRRRRAAGDSMGAAEAVATFSGLAAVAAGVVVAAGIALSWIELGGLHPLTGTTYGRLLLVKIGAVAVILVMAAWNRYRLVPVVAREALDEAPETTPAAGPEVVTSAAWTSLVRLMRLEIVLLVGVLVVTGVLVNVTPGKAAIDRGPVTVRTELGDGEMEVTVDPASPGRNDIHVYLYDADGRPDDSYSEASVRLELPEQDLGPLDRVPVLAAPGHFQLVGTDLALAGDWEITVTVKPDKFTETSGTVDVEVR